MHFLCFLFDERCCWLSISFVVAWEKKCSDGGLALFFFGSASCRARSQSESSRNDISGPAVLELRKGL